MKITKRLLLILADFLEALADSRDGWVSIGQFGPDEPYARKESRQLGPAVREIHAEGLIAPGEKAGVSPRPSRKGGLERCWFSVCRDGCRQRAQEYRRLAERLDDDGHDVRQPTLF
jgi:hypothetical protein